MALRMDQSMRYQSRLEFRLPPSSRRPEHRATELMALWGLALCNRFGTTVQLDYVPSNYRPKPVNSRLNSGNLAV